MVSVIFPSFYKDALIFHLFILQTMKFLRNPTPFSLIISVTLIPSSNRVENAPNIKKIDLSGIEMTTRQSRPFCRLAELSQCSIIITEDSL